MTLQELCSLFRSTTDIYLWDRHISEFYHNIDASSIKSFSIENLDNLHIFCKCFVVSVYEYICKEKGYKVNNDILLLSKNLYCPMKLNSFYLCNKELTGNEDYAKSEYINYLSKSIEPFKSHGIISTEFNFAV